MQHSGRHPADVTAHAEDGGCCEADAASITDDPSSEMTSADGEADAANITAESTSPEMKTSATQNEVSRRSVACHITATKKCACREV